MGVCALPPPLHHRDLPLLDARAAQTDDVALLELAACAALRYQRVRPDQRSCLSVGTLQARCALAPAAAGVQTHGYRSSYCLAGCDYRWTTLTRSAQRDRCTT